MAGQNGDALAHGVDRSFSGKRWVRRPGDDRLGLAIAQRLGLPEIVGRVLAARGVGLDDAPSYLDPRLNRLLPDPSHLIDMDKAVARLARAVRNGEKIAVFGDYDVDGATSSALLRRFFRGVGTEIEVYIPDRLNEGYGPNEPALRRLREAGVDIVVTVDCGTTAYEPLEAAAGMGLDVIVIDHHVAEAGLPKAHAVVNPNRLDEDSPHGQLAAVGVSFLLAVGLNRALRDAGHYAGRPEPDLRQWLDMVALGTVADVVPLTGVNRAFVRQGLKVLAGRENTGLAALADVAGVDEAPGAYHLGFVLGPRINAGGRLGSSDLGARLLSTEDAVEAAEIAGALDEYNQQRRAIEEGVLQAAVREAESGRHDGVVLVSGGDWHPGVIGIVAARLVERFGLPACVVTTEGGKGLGSGRSMAGIDLGAAIIAARQKGLLVNGGGHAMAAGFTVDPDRIGDLRAFLAERLAAAAAAGDVAPRITVDGSLTVEAANLELAGHLERLAPFGSGNAEPRFVLPGVRVAKADVVGADHVRCTFTGGGSARLNAISFRTADTELGKRLLNHGGLPLHVVGRVRPNRWQGRTTVQLMLDDAAAAT